MKPKAFLAELMTVFLLIMCAHMAQAAPPTIDFPPRSQEVVLYQQAAFGVIAGGTPPLGYQWLKNGVTIPGATNDQMLIWQAQFSDGGRYSVVISNAEGSVSSDEAPLAVKLPRAGDLDLSFNPGSAVNGEVLGIAVQPDGRILIGGRFTAVRNLVRNRIARLNADGSPDVTFDPGSGVNGVIQSLLIQPDGKVIVAGAFVAVNGLRRPGIARLNIDGSVDTSFLPALRDSVFPNVTCVALQPDGKVLVGGLFSVSGATLRGVARLTQDGNLDSSFIMAEAGDRYSPMVYAVGVQPDGKIMVGGNFTMINGVGRYSVARLNTNGVLDSSFHSHPGITNGSVRSIAVQTDGRTIIGGWFQTSSGRQGVVRLNQNGSLDTSFGLVFSDGAYGPNILSVLVRMDNKVLVAGHFQNVNGTNRNPILQLHPEGGLDADFDPEVGATAKIYCVAEQPDRAVIIGGNFGLFTSSGTDANHIARLEPEGRVDGSFTSGAALQSGVRSFVMQRDGKVLIGGGYFTTVGNTRLHGVVRLDSNGSLDTSFSPGVGENSVVYSVALQPDGKSLISGELNFTVGDEITHTGMVRLNTDGSLDPTFNSQVAPYFDLFAIAVQEDGKVLLGGAVHLTGPMGATHDTLVRLHADGSLDTGFNPIFTPKNSIDAVGSQPDGKILVGGWFTHVNGFSRNGIARLNSDGSLDTIFDPGTGIAAPSAAAQRRVRSVLVQPDGKVLISGGFTTVDGVNRSQVARLNANGSLDLSFNAALFTGFTDASPVGYSIALQGEKVLLGGNFTFSRGTNRNCLARLNADGSLDTVFNPGPGANHFVFSVAPQSDGKAIIAGTFTTVSGGTRWRIARVWTEDSPPHLAGFTPSGAGSNLTWHAISSRAYRVQYKDDLAGEAWLDLPGDVQAQGHTASKVDATVQSGRQRFYRVMRLP
jgi:uncharacterized delta-60 repeat protein